MSCFVYCYAECHYAECHGTPDCSPLTEHPAEQRQSIMTLSISIKCHYGECHVLFIAMLSVVMLSVMAPQIAAPLQSIQLNKDKA
jgi:hypothetical protein